MVCSLKEARPYKGRYCARRLEVALALFPRGVPHVPLPCCISCFGMHSTTKCPILGSNSRQGHPYLAPTPRESPPPQRTEHRERRDAGLGLLNQEALFTQ